jgi:hypothetical protein
MNGEAATKEGDCFAMMVLFKTNDLYLPLVVVVGQRDSDYQKSI